MDFFVLDFRTSNTGGAVAPGHLTSANPSLSDLQLASNVVFLVHGFNVNRNDGRSHLEKLAGMLPAVSNGATVAVLWPGDSFAGPISYPFETSKADDSALELANFISDNLHQRPRISFVAHSLGSRVVMRTVMALRSFGIAVDQVCLMAAAIDNDSLASSDEYRAATDYVTRVAVLYSPRDLVLELAYPAGNILQAFMHWSRTTDAALGLTGPRARSSPNEEVPADVRPDGISKGRNAGHGDYIPGDDAPNRNQLSAASYANDVLARNPQPTYP